ncbi:NAD(P)/FAD-dependent oxidoreductase [Saltatorellus ferox]|uniref:NAD(P)/FAD-dependent oxidoreductase n=1 Tax=Saltatorellus ferox TaxID=2528018 RepID=UPI003AF3FC90
MTPTIQREPKFAGESALPTIVVLGGGFGGLAAAKALRKVKARIVVIDRQNHHLFQPLLYQVATAGLAAPDIASPIRRILRKQKNTEVRYAEVTAIDPETKTIAMGDRSLGYDYLVIATGATHSYFGNDQWGAVAPGLKTLEDAHEIRAKVLRAFESAEVTDDAEEQRAWLRMVVVGAGPTGVELAGALAELSRKILDKDFRHFDPRGTEVLLIEGGPRVLLAYPEDLSEKAEDQLRSLGVTVRKGAMVSNITEEGVTIGEAEFLPAKTVLWAAGVQASRMLGATGAKTDRAGRVQVERDLSMPGHPEVFVIGDAAHFEQYGAQIPGVAPAAMQMGRHAGDQIQRLMKSRGTEAFHYTDKGSMATIGRASAVANFRGRHLSGFLAWMAWLFIHLIFLIGFRSRLVVLINWFSAYVGYRPAARVFAEMAKADDSTSPRAAEE